MPIPGEVWNYPYVWVRPMQNTGMDKPAAVAVATGREDGRTAVYLLPVIGTEPPPERSALPVPEIEKHRASVPQNTQLWVILDEYNADLFEVLTHLSPTARLGGFSPHFLRALQLGFRDHVAQRGAARVQRVDTDQ